MNNRPENKVDDGFPEYRSVARGIVFPAMPSLKISRAVAIARQLEGSQWWSAEKLKEHQYRQLSILLEHAYRHSPFYRQRLNHAHFALGAPLSPTDYLNIPVLTRSELQSQSDELLCKQYPKEHGRILTLSSSGSTGAPVTVKQSQLCQIFFRAFNLRDHLWHRRDFTKKLASIKADLSSNPAVYPHGRKSKAWGMAGVVSGESWVLKIDTPVRQQIKWLEKLRPDYLLTYPTNLAALIDLYAEQGIQLPGLKQVSTMGEALDDEIAKRCQQILGVEVVDLYSCQEIGILASRCPDNEYGYHVHSESVILEVLNKQGQPCAIGETGRVVITSLHNFVMPLIRYEIGDYAEVGESCSCGRGLPVIRKILGRKRGMLTLPNGDKYWPMLGLLTIAKQVDKKIRQVQVVQKSIAKVEVRIAMEGRLNKEDEAQVIQTIQKMLNHSFNIEVVYLEGIKRSKGGKFEDFVSEVQ